MPDNEQVSPMKGDGPRAREALKAMLEKRGARPTRQALAEARYLDWLDEKAKDQ